MDEISLEEQINYCYYLNSLTKHTQDVDYYRAIEKNIQDKLYEVDENLSTMRESNSKKLLMKSKLSKMKAELVLEKYHLQYGQWVNNSKLNEALNDTFSLSEQEWNDIKKTESKLLFLRRRKD